MWVLLSENDLALFARVSGDRNPLHTSADYARATPFGRTVVHGVLALVATLDEWRPQVVGVSSIDVEFRNPVHPGIRYRAEATGESPAGIGCQLLDGDRVCLEARVRPGPAGYLDYVEVAPPASAAPRAIADLAPGTAVSGEYGPSGVSELDERFPNACALLGRVPLLCLLWASHLAGMLLPGERCLLSGLSLRFRSVAVPGQARLSYAARVVDLDARFGLASIGGEVTAAGEVVGEAAIEAVVRTPAPPASSAAIGAHLSPSTRLLGRSAAVVGGSRGLGAAVTLALAGQGCEVYVGHRGRLPEALLAEGEDLPGRLWSVPGDAGSQGWIRNLRCRVEREHGRLDLLVCCAAPPLRVLDLSLTHLGRFNEFLTASLRLVSTPLAGVLDLVETARGRCLVISSSALCELPLDWPHYVAAKSAVEGLVRWAARHHPDVGFLLARPGMLRTEQTNTPGARETATAVEPVAAELVRQLLDAAPTAGVPLLVDDLTGVPPAGPHPVSLTAVLTPWRPRPRRP
jgi:NAD(P)-dependent dehydrogenase (short-subunit alcohol dehydrogenase family)/3-hydroxymyristoyl/3-hydroxydecanoyl-(acyl carrier protein) dehydratase